MRLDGKVAVVTGAGSGIGRACALRFAAEGARVVSSDRHCQTAEATAAEIRSRGGDAIAIQADVAVVDDTRRIIDGAMERYGTLHVLLNNAATVDLQKPVQELTVEEWDQCVDASLRSVFLLAKWSAPHIRDSGGGSIINIASVGAIMAWGGGAPYCAAKSGVLALSKVLAIEYGTWGIRVNALSPGSILTPNLIAAMELKNTRKILEDKNVFHRLGEPDEIAAVAVFLASDEASFVTGTNVVADGGYLTV